MHREAWSEKAKTLRGQNHIYKNILATYADLKCCIIFYNEVLRYVRLTLDCFHLRPHQVEFSSYQVLIIIG